MTYKTTKQEFIEHRLVVLELELHRMPWWADEESAQCERAIMLTKQELLDVKAGV